MKTTMRKITRLCTALALIAGVIAFKGTTYVHAEDAAPIKGTGLKYSQ